MSMSACRKISLLELRVKGIYDHTPATISGNFERRQNIDISP